jgi:phosphoketolase
MLFERETRAVIVDGEAQRLLRRVLATLDRETPPPAHGEMQAHYNVWDPEDLSEDEDESDSDDTEPEDGDLRDGGKVVRLFHMIGAQVRYLAFQDNDAGKALLHRVRAVWLRSPQHARTPRKLVVKEMLDRMEMQVQNMPKRRLPDWAILRWLEDFRDSLDRWYI